MEKSHHGYIFWNLWKERDQRVFTEKIQTYTKLFDNVIYHAIFWCKLSNIFASYSHTSLIVDWEVFFFFFVKSKLSKKKKKKINPSED